MTDLPPSIAFRLRGTKSNRDAIGAAVTVETSGRRQTRMLQAGSGFLAQHSKELIFGLGDAEGPVRASIRWPSGLVQELHEIPVNHRIWVQEGAAPNRMEAFTIASKAAPSREAALPQSEPLPTTIETWLVAPIPAPDLSLIDSSGTTRSLSALRGKSVLLSFWTSDSTMSRENLELFAQAHLRWSAQGLQLLAVYVNSSADTGATQGPALERFSFPVVRSSDDLAGVYNTLYRYLFDRHRDLSLPTSFLIDETGDIVKIYQGPVIPDHVDHDVKHIPRSVAERVAKALPFAGRIDDPDFRRNYLSLGSLFFQREYFDQAEVWFGLALRDDASSAEALYGLGSVYLRQEKEADARKSFEKAVRSRAGYPETLPNAWNNLGLLATREGQTDQAIEFFRKALQLSPDHLVALENLGNAYRQQKRWDEALKTLQKATIVSPEDPEANYALGMVFAQTDDNDHAYEYLQRALRFRPGYPEALNNLGVLYLRTRRHDEAVASFQECIKVAPAFDQAYLNLAKVYELEGAPEKARAVLLDLLKRHPSHAQAAKMLEQLTR
jgi:tetratricopeptide (TPR) repeat protein